MCEKNCKESIIKKINFGGFKMITEEQFLTDLKEMLKAEDEIEMDTDLMDIENWDSFSMMTFITMAEDNYGAKFEPFAIAGAVLVEDLYNVVKDALEGK